MRSVLLVDLHHRVVDLDARDFESNRETRVPAKLYKTSDFDQRNLIRSSRERIFE
jgi:hypothetical protein